MRSAAAGLDPVKLMQGASLFLTALFVSLPVNWKTLVKVSLYLVVFEGAIRKWLLPGLSQFVYFGKDFVILLAYLKYFSSRHELSRPMPFDPLLGWLIFASSTFILIEAGNFALGSPVVGIFGVKNYLMYVPLVLIMQHLFDSQEELADFLKRYLCLVLPITALAVMQSFSSSGSAINMYVAEEDAAKALVGSRVRVTGSFSYIAGFSAYMQTMSAMVIPMLVLQQKRTWQLVLRLVFVSILVSILLSGSRTPVISVALFVIGYFVCNRVLRKLGLYRKFAVPAFVVALVLIYFLSASLEGIVDRFSDKTIFMRIFAGFYTPVDYTIYSGLFGYGSGSTFQAVDRIRELLELPKGDRIPVFYESEPERIMLELGPIGFSLWYALRIRVIAMLWKTYLSLSMPLLRELALSAFLVHATALLGHLVFQVTFSVYYWFLAGFIYLLPRLQAIAYGPKDTAAEQPFHDIELQEMEERSWA